MEDTLLDMEALTQSSNFLSTVLENMHSSIFLLTKERRIKAVNRSGMVLLDKNKKAIINNLFGNALDCMNTERGDLQCGYTDHCRDCPLLNALNSMFEQNIEVRRDIFDQKKVLKGDEILDKYFMYSAKTIVHEGTTMVMLIVDDITEMEKQKEAIRAKNEEIMSGIRYAKKIQDALLPARQELLHALHDYFLLYRPRDVIGGDFYRTIRKDNKTILAVGDCTGHGIPGALLSMLGITGLNEIVKANGITRPDEVLFKLRTQIISELTNHDEEHLPHDGIDIAICTLDHDDRRLQFAGANSNIFFARNGKMSEIKGDRMPAGIYHQMNAFSLQEIAWEEGDMLYLFSDGYKDQFGGEMDKKFGKKRFAELLTQVSLQNVVRQKEMLDKTLDDWKGHKEQVDDILVMGVRLD